MKATHILWDVDEGDDISELPSELGIPDGMEDEDEISDYLSDMTGYCHSGYCLEND